MKRGAQLDVLLALLGTRTDGAVDGTGLNRRLELAGHQVKPSALLAHVLALETIGFVTVDRADGYRFALTEQGEATAYELGPGDPIEVVLVMVDLVGYVAFTEQHGDSAAHDAARRLQDVGDAELRRVGGKLVKPLGDGFLGTVRTRNDAVKAVRTVAQHCHRPEAGSWRLRAAVHQGRPIAFRGDLFGGDVNLASRLCAAAGPGELVMTTTVNDPSAEQLDVRGLAASIPITRMAVL